MSGKADYSPNLSVVQPDEPPPPPEGLLHGGFFAQAACHPNRVALIQGPRQITYGRLAGQALAIAARLRTRGVAPEATVAIGARDPLHMTAGLLGILAAGGAYVPLDNSYPELRLTGMLEDAKASLVLGDEELRQKCAPWTAKPSLDSSTSTAAGTNDNQTVAPGWISLTELLAGDDSPSGVEHATQALFHPSRVATRQLAYVIFTSGSTGRPKGVQIEHGMAQTTIPVINRLLSVTAADRVLAVSSFSFDLSVYDIFGLLAAGGGVVFPESGKERDPRHWLELIASQRITLWNSVPALFEMLATWCGGDIAASRAQTATLREALLSGDWIPPSLPDRWRAIQPRTRLVSLGGATEGSIWSIYHPIEQVDSTRPSIPYGRALPGQQMYVLDGTGQMCPAGVTGEIHIGGPGVARGYAGRPDLTAERFIPDHLQHAGDGKLYKTGDLGRYFPDGTIEFLGRADQQVKIGGYRIELGEIETALRRHPQIAEAVVVARRDRGPVPYLAAYYQPRTTLGTQDGGLVIAESDLAAELATTLPAYMLPASYVLVNNWPLTANGKVDRQALPTPELSANGQAANDKFDATTQTAPDAAPRYSPQELVWRQKLLPLWNKALGQSQTDDDAGFLRCGGDSLRAVELVLKVAQTTGVTLSPVWPLGPDATLHNLVKIAASQAAQASPKTRCADYIVPRTKSQPSYPVSYPQRQLWLADQLAGDSPCYNVPLAWEFHGELRVSAWQTALAQIVQRHEILRTVYVNTGGHEVRQRVLSQVDLQIPLVDLSSAALPDARQAAIEAISADARARFDVAAGPLLRAAVYRLAPREYILSINIHHLNCDGWTVGMLGRELSQLYQELIQDQTLVDAPSRLHYADYAIWQRETAKFDQQADLAEYWKSTLHDLPENLLLPTDAPRPTLVAYTGAAHRFTIDAPLTAGLEQLARQTNTSLFAVLLTAWQILLARISGQDEFCLGTPSAGRQRSGLTDLWGYLIHVLPLRCRHSTGESALDLLVRNARTVAAALANQDYPFESIIKNLGSAHLPHAYPLFPAMIVLEEDPANYWQLAGGSLRELPIHNQTAKYEMLLSLMTRRQADATVFNDSQIPDPSGAKSLATISGVWEYRDDLFTAARIQRMCGQWLQILRHMVAAPHAVWHDLPLLTPLEQSALTPRPAWRNTAAAACANVLELFADQARRHARVAAIHSAECDITYAELYARAMALAARLQQRGVRPDTLVGLSCERSPAQLICVLAILQAGGAYVPLDPALPPERLSRIMDIARPFLVLGDSRSPLARFVPPSVWLDVGQLLTEPLPTPEYLPCPAGPENLAYVLFTSGSTGEPKGVAMPHRALVNLLLWQVGESELPVGARTLQFASLGFDVSFQEIFGTWCAGGTVVPVSEDQRSDFAQLAGLICDHQIARLFLPFVALEYVAAALLPRVSACPHLTQIITAGEQLKITPRLREFFSLLPRCRLWNHYGPTECHVVTSAELTGDPATWPELPPIGRPIANTVAYVLDRRRQPLPPGVPGELFLGGACVARGYLSQPELTAEKFLPNPLQPHSGDLLYRTGDYAFWNDAGELQFQGRRDDQVKIRGHRIELGDVEAALRQNPAINQAAVLALRDSAGDLFLHAFVAGQGDSGQKDADFCAAARSDLATRLPVYMLPQQITRVSQLPLTPNGKVDRAALSALLTAKLPGESAAPECQNYHERRMLRVWRQVLQQRHLRPEDDFYDLGGDSLLAARLFTAVEREFGVQLSLSELLTRSTPRSLTRLILDKNAPAGWNCLLPIQESGELPPLYVLPGIGGGLVDYFALSRIMGNTQPIYGLQPQGSDGKSPPLTTVPQIAAQYAEQIRRLQPRGPYHILGYSFGGVVAYELAQQLRERDLSIGSLTLVDVSFEDAREEPLHKRIWFHLRYLFSGQAVLKARYFTKRLKNFLRRMKYGFHERSLDYTLECMDLTPASRHVAAAHWEAWTKYRPVHYDGPVTVLLAGWRQGIHGDDPQAWGWEHLVPAGVTTHRIPGTHENLFKGQNLQILAKKLHEILAIAHNCPESEESAEIAVHDAVPLTVG
ncbi:MAG: amino acid adenylation domain-containing protein [Pirellulales bacterium]|nr:amino acid adenylation domain-containing protein [Pirellulales bacterium]